MRCSSVLPRQLRHRPPFDTGGPRRVDPEFDAGLCVCACGDRPPAALCWTSAFIKDLAVTPAARRQGLAEALLRHAFVVFRSRGASEIALKVENGNADALRLYHRLGFRP